MKSIRVIRRVLICFLLGYSVVRAESFFQIVSHEPDRLVISITTPEPVVRLVEQDGARYSLIRVAGWDSSAGRFPTLALLLHLSGSSAQYTVLSETNARISAWPPRLYQDVPINGETIDSTASLYSTVPPDRVTLRYLGLSRESHLWSLQIVPFQYADGVLTFTKNLLLEITTHGSQVGKPQSISERTRLSTLGAAAMADYNRIDSTPSALAKQPAFAGPRVKILLNQDGLYRISGADLKAIGLNAADLEIKRLRLTCNGVDVPIYVSGWQDGRFQQEDYFEFWGEALRRTRQQQAPELYQDPFSSTNIYWLSWQGAAGSWMSEDYAGLTDANAGERRRPLAYYETVHVERDLHFDRLNDIFAADSLRDLYYFDSGVGAGSKKNYPFTAPWPDFKSPLGLQLTAWLSGRSTLSTEHRVSLFLNDQHALSGSGYRQSLIHLQTRPNQLLSVTALSAEQNHLTVINQVEDGAIDFIMLNWFEVTYPRMYRAFNGVINFTIPPDYDPGLFEFQVDGFRTEAVDVYKLGISRMVGCRTEYKVSSDGFSSFVCTFEDQVLGREIRYVAVEQSAKKSPLRMEWQPAPWRPAEAPTVDYLVVSSRRFISSAALKKLLDHRQSQGYHVLAVAVEDLYDAFDEGRYGSLAVKKGLSWYYQHAQPPGLKYVLLVGDGCYQRNQAGADSLDLIPVHYRRTLRYGATAGDHWYALLSGADDIADVHIGRLPVRTENELQIVVDKTIALESAPAKGDWRHRLLFIGGNGMIFREKATELAHKAPDAWDSRMLFTTRIPSGYDPFYGSTADLLDHLDQGCLVVNFHGHGGGAIWSDNGLLRLEDVARLRNHPRYPLILSMTCYTGAFDALTNQSLADVLLMTPEVGVCAFLGASGLGWVTNDDLLQNEIMNYLYEHPQQTIGEIIQAGKIRYLARFYSDVALSEINQYNLLGDPAGRLMAPQQNVALTLENNLVEKGDTLAVSCRLPFSHGQCYWQMVDSALVPLESKTVSFNSPQVQTSFVTPSTLTTGLALLRLYAADEMGVAACHGAAAWSVTGSLVDSVTTVLTDQDSLYVAARIAGLAPFRSVTCRLFDASLNMTARSDGWFISAAYPVTPLTSVVQFQIIIQEQSGGVRTTPMYQRTIKNIAGLYLDRNAVVWGGSEAPMLIVPVSNQGTGNAKGLYLRLEEADSLSQSFKTVAMDTLSCAALSSRQVALPYSPAPGVRLVRLVLDSDRDGANGWITQSLFPLQSQAFAYDPKSGIAGGDTLYFDQALTVAMPAGVFSTPAVLHVRRSMQPLLFDQTDLTLSGASYTIAFSTTEKPQKPITISLPCDPDAPAALYRFTPATKKWRRLDSRLSDRRVTATVSESGEYALLYGVDTQPPRCTVSIDGRPFQPNMYVSAGPLISILLQDQNGIDWSSGSPEVLLDGKPVEALAVPDSIVNANELALQGIVALTIGDHRLVISCRDCFGNPMEPVELQWTVAGDFRLQVLGTFPNPFATKTVLAYRLTQPVDKLLFKIYTASGRLIRTIDPRLESEDPLPLTADYHELTWDGTDHQGHPVANGVYFYRITVQRNQEMKEASGKIARIR